MASNWASSAQDQPPYNEYETLAELWLSNKNSPYTGMRKLQASQQRKRNNDKRDSVAQLAGLGEGSPKKLREKSSWLGMSRGYATTASGDGHWVNVRCQLSEMDGSECRLTIVGDKETLQHSLNIRVLKTTDIRFADRSLFFRSDCLSIHAPSKAFKSHSPSLQTLLSSSNDQSGRRQTSRYHQPSNDPVLEPIYLAFESKDAVNCWSALLRSYTEPEIYGRSVDDRGLFRMWRQIDITVMYGRSLGVSGKLASTDTLTSTTALNEPDRCDGLPDAPVDSQVFCEVLIDGIVAGRTMFQKGQAGNGSEPTSWTWLEGFTLSDLPPFGIFTVRVWRFKKSSKPSIIGAVEINVPHFRRAQLVEGWLPVMSCSSNGNNVHVGDLKLKLRVDEEIILPSEAYSSITTMLDKHNCLDLLSELDQRMHLGKVSCDMLSLAVGRGTFLKDITELAEREVDKAPNANTLFRGNSVFTKAVEQAMIFFGRPFLEASVGPCIQELCTERVELETDPSRNTKGPKDLEQSVRLLPLWCLKFWTNIYKMRDHCPSELRRLFQSIRELVERRFGANDASSNLKWQSVSAFCFLRLIVPAILHPHLWGLHPGLPAPGLQRSLTLIAKALQSLANLSKEKKESHMQGVSSFLEQNHAAMIDYIIQISNPLPERSHPDVSDRYDRLLIIHALQRKRESTRELTPLASETIPVLPHLLDIPKHLAVLSSAVIRHSRITPDSVAARPTPLMQESLVEDFALKCCDIETKVVQCVSILQTQSMSAAAAHRHSQSVHSRPSNIPPFQDGHVDEVIKHHPSSLATNNPPSPGRRAPRPHRETPRRPSTAPAASSSNSNFSTVRAVLPSDPLTSSQLYNDHNIPSTPNLPTPRSPRQPIPTSVSTHREPARGVTTPPNSQVQGHQLTIRRSLSQQLDPLEIKAMEDDVNKRRGRVFRGWLARSAK